MAKELVVNAPSLLLLEDHALMGNMLSRFLQERGKMKVWALVETAEEALEKLSHLGSNSRGPDLALVDVSLPGMSGIELVAELGQLYPALPCLMVSAHRDASYVRRALDKGARGYVAKGTPAAIIEAVGVVLAGERYLSEEISQELEGGIS